MKKSETIVKGKYSLCFILITIFLMMTVSAWICYPWAKELIVQKYYKNQYQQSFKKLAGRKVETWYPQHVFELLEAVYRANLDKDLSILTQNNPELHSNSTNMCSCSNPTPDFIKIYTLMDDLHRLGHWGDKLYNLVCLIQLERDKAKPEQASCYDSAKSHYLEEIWPMRYSGY